MTMQLSHGQRVNLAIFLSDRFSMAEMDDLCFRVGIPRGNLAAGTQSGLAREIVQYAERHVMVEKLLKTIADLRPNEDLSSFGWTGAGAPTTVGAASSEGTRSTTTVTPAATEYVNFDIHIAPQNTGEGRYTIQGESVTGETGWIEQTLPADEDFTDQVAYLRRLLATPEFAEEAGDKMRQFLFPPKVWNLYRSSLAKVQAEGKEGLRIRLRIDLQLTELSRIPWEYCRDDRDFMALNSDSPFVRYISTDRAPEPIGTPDTVRILVALASPEDFNPLNVAAEEKRIREVLSGLSQNGRVELHVLPHASRRDLRLAIHQFKPHVLHFSGHGALEDDGAGALVLEGANGKAQLADAKDMSVLLRSSDVKLVVLSACETAAHAEKEESAAFMGVAPRLVWSGMPAVVAMQFKVPEKTATAFMHDLYDFLAGGDPLDVAVTQARIGSFFDHDDKIFWAIPVLFMRAPDGVIWS